MSCRPPIFALFFMGLLVAICGCHPVEPFYLRDHGDLSYYLDQATEVDYPDVHTQPLEEVTHARDPITVTDSNFESFWDMTLEKAISMALQNTLVVRGYGTPGLQAGRVSPGIDGLTTSPASAGTIYSVAIRETEPGFIPVPGQTNSPAALATNTQLDAQQGVEAALAEFDADWTTSVFYNKTDQPRNVVGIGTTFTPTVFVQDQVNLQSEIAKKTAAGTQIFFRSVNTYTKNNVPAAVQPLASVWQTALEMEFRQPLGRGRGTFINRMGVVIARIGTDQEIAQLDAQLQNMVTNVEIRYWDLYCAYRNLQSAKEGRDAALRTYRQIKAQFREDQVSNMEEGQAREQYFFFRAQLERTWADLLDAETNLRWLLGIATTDDRLIRPVDEPVKARVHFDWCEAMDEALMFRPILRLERWEIKKRELALAYAKNSLLPNINAVALYRWLGLGEKYATYEDGPPPFPAAGSGAWNELLGGSYQEYQLGIDMGMKIGFRRELANVRNSQLKLAEEIAVLEDLELDVSRELTQAIRALDLNYELAQTNFNRWAAASQEYDARYETWRAGKTDVSFLLDSQRRRAQAEIEYFQAVCEYNKLIALIHRRKGTILDYDGVCYEEGPWPDKAYWDAKENARRRSASRQVNYGC